MVEPVSTTATVIKATKATVKAAKAAKKALDKKGISPGGLIMGGLFMGLVVPMVLVIGLIMMIGMMFSNSGDPSNPCAVSGSDDYTMPVDYSFTLPPFDPDPAKRERTKNPNAVPGPVPEQYDNGSEIVPYLAYMQAAEKQFHVPWYMLAAISWQETRHGADATTWDRNATADHSYGPMQFIPGTFSAYGVDGDSDHVVEDSSVADEIYAAANLLVKNGFLEGQAGVIRAIGAYNPYEWYKNDVLFWAEKYAAGNNGTDTISNTLCNGLDSGAIAQVVQFVIDQVGKSYVWGTEGPDTFDCSGLMFAAFKTVGVTLARTAHEQADDPQIDIIARRKVDKALLMPGDLLFYDNGDPGEYSSRLKANIGHVAMYIGNNEVVAAASTDLGVIRTTYDDGDWDRVIAAGRVKGMVAAGGATGPWAAPVNGATPSSPFGPRKDPVTGKAGTMHQGQDLAAPCLTPIYAVADGTVIFAGAADGYGNYIAIDHGAGFHTGYGHEENIYVTLNQHVTRGQHIADVGSRGKSTGCHLHFNTIEAAFSGPWSGTYKDPRPALIAHGVNYWGRQ
jgi:cell wall-associated NlpC family hydrolase